MLVKAIKIDQKSACTQDFLSPTRSSASAQSGSVTEFYYDKKHDDMPPMERL